MSKICPNSIQNMFQNFPKYVQNLWKIGPNISKICPTFVHNLFQTAQNLLKIIRKNLKKSPDSVQNQLKFRSKYVKNPAKECLKYVKNVCQHTANCYQSISNTTTLGTVAVNRQETQRFHSLVAAAAQLRVCRQASTTL